MRFILCLTLLVLGVATATPNSIVVSVGPIAALINPLLEGQNDISVTVLNPNPAVHESNITPKEARLIESANRVYWFGPSFEHGMASALENLAGERLQSLNAVIYPKAELEHHHDEKEPDEKEHEEDDHDDEHVEEIAHLHPWLNLAYAKTLINFLSSDLIALAPEHRALFTENEQRFIEAIEQLEVDNINNINTLKPNYYISDHASFNEFTQYFGLRPIMAIQPSEERTPSVKQMRNVTNFIDNNPIQCLLYTNKAKEAMLKASFPQLKTRYVDIIGVDSDYRYIALIQGVINDFMACTK